MPILGTKEWMPNSRNICDGCENDCLYCYGKMKGIRYKRRTKEDWHEMRLLKVRQSTKKVEGGIMFPTTHDLHYRHRDCWLPFLKEMLVNGNDVLIVSKPQLESINLICSTLYKYKSQIEFRFTIGTLNEHVRKFWEPNAPTMEERVDALNCAYTGGFRTSVSMEPVLTKYPDEVINAIQSMVTETIWIGCMNHMSKKDFTCDTIDWYERIQEINSYNNMKRIYEQLKDNPKIRWKDSVRDLLELK